MKTLKEKIHAHCLRYIQERISHAQQAIASVQDSGAEETKSSAGDKFETSREMMKQEIERAQQLLADAHQIKQTLEALVPKNSSTGIIGSGSLVHTDQGLFYLTVGIGRIQVEGRDIVVLSPAAPIGKMLLGKRVWEQISFNGRNYTIEAVD